MYGVNKTLYIPLYGKALVSSHGVILEDKKAEEIWESAEFPLKRRARSKHLAYYMSMRARVFDLWLENKLAENENALVLHLGCGLDSRVLRVKSECLWYDIDFDEVICERKRFFEKTERYHMVSADISNVDFIKNLPNSDTCLVILEGVAMYLEPCVLTSLFKKVAEKYPNVCVLMDVYTSFGAKMSKIKNPIKTVGAGKVYGIKNKEELEGLTKMHVSEREMTPSYLTDELSGMDKGIFKLLYAGKISKKIYKLYELEKK